MKRLLYILLLISACAVAHAQRTIVEVRTDTFNLIQHADTFRAHSTEVSQSDAYLLDMLLDQGRVVAARRDSMEREVALARAIADSIARADSVRRAYIHPLTLPLRFRPEMRFSLMDTAPENKYGDVYAIRRTARRYLSTHAAAVYTGTETGRLIEAEKNMDVPYSTFGVGAIAPGIVKDAEEDRLDRIRALRVNNNPWTRELNVLVQFSQNYVSGNWYAGGNSSFAAIATVKGHYNYDAKKRLIWENTLEWRLGASTVQGDSLRKANLSDDIFKLYSKMGLKMVDKVYVSVAGEFQTTLARTWKPNERALKTGPFAPLRINLTLGVDYKPVKGLSLLVSPLAYKMVYASDTVRTPYTSFGIPAGSNILNEIGSSLRVEWTWNPLRELSLNTIFYTYTNYKMVEIDWEITADFIINRFLSTRLTLHPRYDSSRVQEGDTRAKMQFKELLSIGFAHKFR